MTVNKVEEMLKTLEVINNCAGNQKGIEELKREIINIDSSQAEILYFKILAKVLNEKSMLLPVDVRALPIEALNAAMHYMHLDHGDKIRGRAIREIGEYDACVLFTQYNVGVGDFPRELDGVVSNLLDAGEKHSDLHVEKATTWKNSHDTWGFQYFYKANEFPCLRIRSVSEEARNLFLCEAIEICDKHEEPIIVSLFGPSSPEEDIVM